MYPGGDGEMSTLLRGMWVAVGLAHSGKPEQRLHNEVQDFFGKNMWFIVKQAVAGSQWSEERI